MARPDLSGPALDAAARQLLDGWLGQLADAIPAPARRAAPIVAELRDGLYTAAEYHRARGLSPISAAQGAIAEFGDPHTVAASFQRELTARHARGIAVTLVASGPLVGLTWLGTLVPPLWPPRPGELFATTPLYLVVLAVAVPAAMFAIAATGPAGRWLPNDARLAPAAATVAAAACSVGDGLLLIALARIALVNPDELWWPVAMIAAMSSATRLILSARAAHRCTVAGAARQ